MGDVTGGVAGVSVRFLSMCSESTKVKFMTEGILLREMLANPLLSEYSVIMIDEVNKKSIN